MKLTQKNETIGKTTSGGLPEVNTTVKISAKASPKRPPLNHFSKKYLADLAKRNPPPARWFNEPPADLTSPE